MRPVPEYDAKSWLLKALRDEIPGKLFGRLMPKLFGSVRVRADGRRRRERASRDSTYECQLRAFVGAILDGAPFPTTADDAVRNMVVIDRLLVAAGLQPAEPVRSSSG